MISNDQGQRDRQIRVRVKECERQKWTEWKKGKDILCKCVRGDMPRVQVPKHIA